MTIEVRKAGTWYSVKGHHKLYERLGTKGNRTSWGHKLNREVIKIRDANLDSLQDALIKQQEQFPVGVKTRRRSNRKGLTIRWSDEIFEQFLDTLPNHETRRSYRSAWQCHIKPLYDGERISATDEDAIVRVFEQMRETGYLRKGERVDYSDSSLHIVQSALSKFFQVGMEKARGWHVENPVRNLETSEKVQRELAPALTEADILSPEQVEELAVAIGEVCNGDNSHRLSVMVRLAPMLGLRISEMLALGWEHILWDKRRVLVIRQLAGVGSRKMSDRGSWFSTLKGSPSNGRGKSRKVILSEEAVALLREYFEWTKARTMTTPISGLLFTTNNLTPFSQSYVCARLAAARELTTFKAGTLSEASGDVTFHHFRHIFASRLFALGMGYGEVALQLGDTEKVTRETYVTFFDDAAETRRYDERVEAARLRAVGS